MIFYNGAKLKMPSRKLLCFYRSLLTIQDFYQNEKRGLVFKLIANQFKIQ
jgi:hypothetical protein